MCVPAGYETWTFYSIALVFSIAYFFLLDKVIRYARERAIDPTPYKGSLFLIAIGAHGLAGLKVGAQTVEQDIRLFEKTMQRLFLLSMGFGIVSVVAIMSTLHCHMVLQ
jgi:hypothetical protein